MTTKPTAAITNRVIELRNLLDAADQRYYNGNGRGGLTDAVYDEFKCELKTLNPNCAQLTRVGAPVDKSQHRKEVRHSALIGSINDAMTEAELRKQWIPGETYIATYKVDGLTLVNTYKCGDLLYCATRGDGHTGDVSRDSPGELRIMCSGAAQVVEGEHLDAHVGDRFSIPLIGARQVG